MNSFPWHPPFSLLLCLSSWTLNHRLYLTCCCKCIEVAVVRGSQGAELPPIPSMGWRGAELTGSVVGGFWSCLCCWATRMAFCSRCRPRSILFLPGTEVFLWTATPTAVFVFFLLKRNRTKKYLAVTIRGTFNLLNPQNIFENINSWLLVTCLRPVFLLS